MTQEDRDAPSGPAPGKGPETGPQTARAPGRAEAAAARYLDLWERHLSLSARGGPVTGGGER